MLEKIKQLRKLTEAPLLECKKALEKSNGDIQKALEILKEWQKEFSKRKEEREVKAGVIDVYLHSNKKIGVILQLECESDFVSQNPEFSKLAHEICLQIAAQNPQNIQALLEQNWIRDDSKKILDLIEEAQVKFGEKIVVRKFERYEL